MVGWLDHVILQTLDAQRMTVPYRTMRRNAKQQNHSNAMWVSMLQVAVWTVSPYNSSVRPGSLVGWCSCERWRRLSGFGQEPDVAEAPVGARP